MDQVSIAEYTVIVTGANSGVGKATAMELARRGACVIMACRNQQRADAARAEIVNETGNENVVVKILDLASLESVKRFADDINKNESRLDILVNNAAVMTAKREMTADGFEMLFQVNHLGHFYLTYLLLDKLKASAPSRIVTVSSEAHEMYKLDFDDLQIERGWSWIKAYGRSKTANILFSQHLAKILNGTGVTTYSVNPGLVESEIERQISDLWTVKIMQCFRPCCYKTIPTDEGAAAPLYCCLEPTLANETGLYYCIYSEQRRKRAKPHATDPELAERLWNISKEMCHL